MSKSLGNGIDPLELIDKYGADTLRVSLSMGVAPGSDIRFSEDKMEPARNFLNKLWNASRYVLLNSEGKVLPAIGSFRYSPAAKWILHKLNKAAAEVNANFKKYELGLALQKIYDLIWSDFCDWFIELTKPTLYGANEKKKLEELAVLDFVLKEILKLLHPFAPFITEEIWSAAGDGKTIMTQKYPIASARFNFKADYQKFEALKDVIKSVRNIRAEMNVEPARQLRIYVLSSEASYIAKNAGYIEKLAKVSEIKVISSKEEAGTKCVNAVTALAEIFIPLGDLVDFDKEIARLNKELAALKTEIAKSKAMLGNPGFVAKAPKQRVEEETARLAVNKDKAGKLEARLAELQS